MSRRASGAQLVPLASSSPVIGCKAGSTCTSQQTMSSSSAHRSHISLWCWITKPPCWQIIAWSTVNLLPQTHTDGLSCIGQSYRSLTASRNSCLLRSKSMSLRGITVSQLDAPFSQARSTALCVLSGNMAFTSSSSSFSPSSFSFRVVYTSCCTLPSSGVSINQINQSSFIYNGITSLKMLFQWAV